MHTAPSRVGDAPPVHAIGQLSATAVGFQTVLSVSPEVHTAPSQGAFASIVQPGAPGLGLPNRVLGVTGGAYSALPGRFASIPNRAAFLRLSRYAKRSHGTNTLPRMPRNRLS